MNFLYSICLDGKPVTGASYDKYVTEVLCWDMWKHPGQVYNFRPPFPAYRSFKDAKKAMNTKIPKVMHPYMTIIKYAPVQKMDPTSEEQE